ncbi:MAG: glycoside hydrolase family 3 N-terminal domain-containing protein [Acidimicrobiia bacterium]|nr:glycoside hydrolase family 3 N-terminal domain-containing protein [Acidimicrobiia bacterium]
MRLSRGSSSRAIVSMLAVVAVFSGCTSDPAVTETTAATTTSSPPAVGPPVELVAFSDHLYGVEGVAPEGWSELEYGVLLRQDSATDATLLVQQAAPGASPAEVTSALVAQLELDGPPPAGASIETDHLNWTRYSFETSSAQFGGQLMQGEAALAESEFGTFIIGLIAGPEEIAALTESVFEPAVRAFVPPAVPTGADLSAPYMDPALPTEDRVEDLLSRMTLADKIGQMTQVEKNSLLPMDLAYLGIGSVLSGGGGSPAENTPEAWAAMVDGFQEHALQGRLGIPLIYGVDAVHGHNNVKGATIFPHNVGLGAANDPELMRRIGEVTAEEVAATGIDWNFAPTVAVTQDIRWGRTYESYGEDADLVASLAVAYMSGLQGEDLADDTTVLATPKHFVGDGGTTWGSATTGGQLIDQGVTEVDEETLRAVHLPPYVAAIDNGAESVMVSYSSWNDTRMHAESYLLTDVLKEELGFGGLVLSDWGAIDQISDDYYEAVVTAINAGIDMNMVPYQYRRFISVLWQAVENGDVAIERIDDAVRRILTVKFELGLFEAPFSDPSLLASVGSAEHREVAREAVARSVVLLKNDGGLLPISDDIETIFVGGQAADDVGIQSGGWTIEWQGKPGSITPGTTILEGIEASVSDEVTVYYDRFGNLGRLDVPGLEPDLCIAVVGERPYAEWEGDSADLALASRDYPVLENLAAGCDKVAVVLISGRPLIVTDMIDGWDALVAAWLPGSEGRGVADVLFGIKPFVGKLPFTWPSSIEQVPLGALMTGGEEPLFPYGFGLDS